MEGQRRRGAGLQARRERHRRLRRRLQDQRPPWPLAAQCRRRIQPRDQGRRHHHRQLECRVCPGPLPHREVVLARAHGVQARPHRRPCSPAHRGYRPGLPVLGRRTGRVFAGVADQPHRLRIPGWRQGQLLFCGGEVGLHPLPDWQECATVHQRRVRQAAGWRG